MTDIVQPYRHKKNRRTRSCGQFLSFSVRTLNYLTESGATESAAAESALALSTIAESAVESAVESAFAAGLELPPHDAKEIAAIATNIKTNFFISLLF